MLISEGEFMRKTGKYEFFGSSEHFIPESLPPQNPLFTLSAELSDLYGQAMQRLGALNECGTRLPDVQRFIKAYVIKEALLSSSIEGIHTTLLEVYTLPLSDEQPSKETHLVVNYTRALDRALSLIQKNGLPISSRVICAAHEELLRIGEGESHAPGAYRKQSVRVGNLVPPPAPQVPGLMADLERFINEDDLLPPLIKAGLAHVQFETIHPFLDGNGRIGRLLIVLMLVESGLLSVPIIYPSYAFKKHHNEYYYLLDRVRTKGDFESWIAFYLRVIIESAEDAYNRVLAIEKLEERLMEQLFTKNRLVKNSMAKSSELRQAALSFLFAQPVVRVRDLSGALSITYNTANSIIATFVDAGVLVQQTEQKRDRLFAFKEYLELLDRESFETK
jgi:Fic family protein